MVSPLTKIGNARFIMSCIFWFDKYRHILMQSRDYAMYVSLCEQLLSKINTFLFLFNNLSKILGIYVMVHISSSYLTPITIPFIFSCFF